MHEVANHVPVPASFLGATMMGWAANKPWRVSLPEQDRKTLIKSMDRASKENRKAILEEIDDLAKAYQARGMEVTFLAPEMPVFAARQEARHLCAFLTEVKQNCH